MSPQQRTPLARALGLGSANEGVGHWWQQRAGSVALIPLTIWFVVSLVALSGSGYAEVLAWLGSPVVAVLLILLLIALFQHVVLGLQVVIEDYLHYPPVKISLIVLVQLAGVAFAAAGAGAVLYIVFAG